ncbi:hypothetical protein M8C21_022008, partial [Ambrosia artemisiifolia]
EDIYTIAELSKASFGVILEKQEYSSASVKATAGAKASASAKASGYDVFLSFRGEDTEQSFTNHLNKSLKQAGVSIFMCDVEMNRGEELTPEFVRAIEESRASIIVLSKNYATSTWCLDELVLILEQRREGNHFVLPVFYGVEPTDVRKQKGNFAIHVKPSSRWTIDNVNKWRAALTEVADLAGHVLLGPETSMLKEIVDTIYNKLDIKDVYLPLKILGMATRFEDISSWLEEENLEILVIYGMGGSGKTTLAKYIYGEKKRKIPSVSYDMVLFEEALKTKKTLIVLDDIVEQSQFVALLGTGKIEARSKILEHDYSATAGIKTLINKCLLSISPNKKLMMHRLFQEMGKKIVREESNLPAKRSRVWLSSDSYKILRRGKGSETVEGLVLDMEVLRKDDLTFT